ncbi:hypothetical protein ACPC54_34140 [Kitasatospora sp. NPDC094028]
MTQPATGVTQTSGEMAAALQALLATLVQQALGSQVSDKNGQPLRQVCYMQLHNGQSISPKYYANPWEPGGTVTSTSTSPPAGAPPPSGTTPAAGTAPPKAGAAPTDTSKSAAFRTANLVDRRLLATTDGTYSPGADVISTAYQGLIMKAQGVPAPPPPQAVQDQINAARAVLYVLDAKGQSTGSQTPAFTKYQAESVAWGQARTDFATAEAKANADPALGQAWPEASAVYQQKVDNAWNAWRGDNADAIENALEIVGSQGGSLGTFFVSEAKNLFQGWSLGLGVVAEPTPYSYVDPGDWYDPTATDNGFTTITTTASDWTSSSSDQSTQYANNWYQSHSESSGGGGEAMVYGVTFGVDESSGSSTDASQAQAGGSSMVAFSDQMSDISITYSYGMCTIYRPWLLSELFLVDGWYLPGEPVDTVSDGTLDGAIKIQNAQAQGQVGPEALPMIPTQFMVLRNVSITASNWGDAGDQMNDWCQKASQSDQSSSSSVSGNLGYMGFGGEAHEAQADASGQAAGSATADNSWWFSGSSSSGTLSINGCQIVGWVGEILPPCPRVDGVNPPTGATTASGTAPAARGS